ncbi:MAG: ABC transporter transmembrane domain-containing protein, partial [Oceanicaulis sp.]
MFLLKLFLRAIGALSERGVLIAALILAGTAVAGIQIVEAVLFGRVVNALVEAEPATRVLLTWAVLGALGILINVVLALAADRLAHRNKLKVLVSAFEGALRRPRPVGGEDGSGAVIRTILVGADAFFAAWLSFFRELVPALTALVILFPIAVLMSPALTATLLVLTVLYLAANLFILTRTQSGQREVDAHTRYLASRIGDVMTNASVVHAFTRLAKETEALKVMTRDVLERQYPVLNWWAVLNVFTRASATISVVSVFIVGAFLVGRGELSIGTVVSFAGFAALLIARLEQAAGAITRLFPVAPVMENLLSML